MVLTHRLLLLLAILIAGMIVQAPASAHQNHQRAKAPAAAAPPVVAARPALPGAAVPPSEMQQQMEAHMEEMAAQQPQTFGARLVGWFGRMHPFAVHFPIALFPVALVALVLARRRGEAVELIRALIVVAGAASVVAAVLGWLNGGLVMADEDIVLMLHRWLGTGLAAMAAVIGFWAWRRRASVASGRMVAALSVLVALLLVQGFLGGSVTHGMDHMMF